MPVKKHFVQQGIKNMLVNEFIGKNLEDAGFSSTSLQKTPLGTIITINAARPGIVIGKRGVNIKSLTQAVKSNFNFNIPTIEVKEIDNPDLDPKVQAEKIAYAIEKGQHYRRVAYGVIRNVLRNGGRGVEISVAGKMVSQRARMQVFRGGTLTKCGEPAIEGVLEGLAEVTQKTGRLGIKVKIQPTAYKMPDDIKIRKGIFEPEVEKETVNQPDKFYKDKVESPEDVEEIEIEEEELFDDVSDADVSILEESDDETPDEVVKEGDKVSEDDE